MTLHGYSQQQDMVCIEICSVQELKFRVGVELGVVLHWHCSTQNTHKQFLLLLFFKQEQKCFYLKQTLYWIDR